LIIDGDFISRRVTRGFGEEESDGFYDAMIDGHLGNRVRSLRNGLFLLPTGRVSAADACTVDAPGVKALLDEAMAQYDTVLIDSGPILGSLEATVLAPQVNGVLLTISRGQNPGLVQTAVQRLGSVGAHLAGAVFNRADSRDYYSSAYASASTSVPAAARKTPEPEVRSGPFFDFGPLVSAVARTCRHGMNGNGNGH
jgi:succinoglycan biosynthesis transport protein ExoP